MRYRAVLAAVLLAGFVPFTTAAVHDGVLDNGMRVILIEHRASPMVSSSVIIGAGVVTEPDGMNGASHFLEHLLFNGTTTRTQRQLYDEVDRYGAYNNATTREDHTMFSLLIQTEFARQGMEIQADMLFRSTIPEDKYEKEKGIVLEELARDRNDPGYIARLGFREFAFARTPAARSVLGTETSIGQMRRDDVVAYYEKYYVPGNMTLVLLGDFEIPAMLAVVREVFGAQPGEAVPRSPAGAWPARPENNARTVPLDAPRVYLHAAIPIGWPAHDRRTTSLELLVNALSVGADSPLHRALKGDPALGVLDYSLDVATRGASWTTLDFHATLEDGEAIPAVLERVTAGLADLGPASAARGRVPRVRARERNEEILLADRIHYVAMMRAAYLHGSPEGYAGRRADLLASISEEELDAAADAVRSRIAGIRVYAAGPGFDRKDQAWNPTVAEAAPREASREIVRTLPNGLQVAFRRNDDSRVFAVHVLFRPRSAVEPAERAGITDVVHRVFALGSTSLDPAALAERLDRLGAEMKTHDSGMIPYDDYYTTPEYSFVRFEMPADSWREGIDLLVDILRNPRLDDDTVGRARDSAADVARRVHASASAGARHRLLQALAPGHPDGAWVEGTGASIAAITTADVQVHHAAMLAGRRMIVTGVGPVSPEAFATAIEAGFADLPDGPEFPAIDPAAGPGPAETIELPGDHEQTHIAMGYLLESGHGDGAAWRVAAAILSDRLAFDVRETEGLAYRIGCSVGTVGGRRAFRVALGTRPENVDRAVTMVREILGNPPVIDDDAVARAANAIRGRMLMRRLTRVNLAYFLGLDLLDGRTPGAGRTDLDALLEVRTEDVAAALGSIDPGRLTVVVAR